MYQVNTSMSSPGNCPIWCGCRERLITRYEGVATLQCLSNTRYYMDLSYYLGGSRCVYVK